MGRFLQRAARQVQYTPSIASHEALRRRLGRSISRRTHAACWAVVKSFRPELELSNTWLRVRSRRWPGTAGRSPGSTAVPAIAAEALRISARATARETTRDQAAARPRDRLRLAVHRIAILGREPVAISWGGNSALSGTVCFVMPGPCHKSRAMAGRMRTNGRSSRSYENSTRNDRFSAASDAACCSIQSGPSAFSTCCPSIHTSTAGQRAHAPAAPGLTRDFHIRVMISETHCVDVDRRRGKRVCAVGRCLDAANPARGKTIHRRS